ncbi:MAG: hypothetical protein AAB090_02180 [Nitrospirota bacterium]
MNLSVDEFYRQLRTALQKYLPSLEIKLNEINQFRLKVRITLSNTTFIDIFYGARKNRVDFTLIHQGSRIFGIDNLISWHCHPLGKGSDHLKIEPMSIDEIILKFKDNIEKSQKELNIC